MLGKDYMLAIILVNCDGVHAGARREDWELKGNEGARKATPRLKDRDGGSLWVRTRAQINPDLCAAIWERGPSAWTSSIRVDKELF